MKNSVPRANIKYKTIFQAIIATSDKFLNFLYILVDAIESSKLLSANTNAQKKSPVPLKVDNGLYSSALLLLSLGQTITRALRIQAT